MKKSWLRVAVGLLIGVAGGFSLTVAIFPYITTRFLTAPAYDLGRLFSLAGPIVLLWACGGAGVGWYGGVRAGLLILGLCGALAGFMLSAFAIGGGPQFTLLGTAVGLLYGAPAGFMIGSAFHDSLPTGSD